MAGRPCAWALPQAGALRQGEEEGAELRPPLMDPLLPGSDLRYPVGETPLGGSGVPSVARVGSGGR